ncbi:hypothetical protein KAFR_0C04950 [Kazachstania africana CBS 2517]|uniref:Peroxisome assembly protein 22 n=1 Tax=Kazachstania africana (strain ATCC 22294 / BCRC 22015 / CBS 2517 / CECT 1963 / NBRC 1671 / NRRL Y-8276) TaxID=1071382 RepID=H2ASY6_KAZAF|nr:hypothetical protein KAFR_0C04950 [Kazachstania africana CBS 2517]CCF57486.1 hypothetical protein KAFR_0C04950 [Kazachstania africana CBS 2517]
MTTDHRRLTRNGSLVRTVGTGVVLAIGAGIACWYWWRGPNASQETNRLQQKEEEEHRKEREKEPSRCVIVTKTLSEMKDFDWQKFLKDDIVFIVVPGETFLDPSQGFEIDPKVGYKIIRCDTILGVWSCVKSLKKDSLIVIGDEVEGGIPDDISNFTKNIRDVKSKEELLTIFPIPF